MCAVSGGSGSGAGPGFVKIEATNNQILLTNKLGTVMHARLIDAYTLYNVDTGKYIARKNGKLDLGGLADVELDAADAVVRRTPLGGAALAA